METPQAFRRARELVTILQNFPREQTIIAVDAPRSVPDHHHEDYARRSCETQLQAATGEHVGSFAGVTALFIRWHEIETGYLAGWRVIETYPRAVWAQLKIPGKPKHYRKRAKEICVAVAGVTGLNCRGFTSHQLDATLAAFTAWCYARGQVHTFGVEGEGLMVLPDLAKPAGSTTPRFEVIAETFRRFPSQRSTKSAHLTPAVAGDVA